MPRKCPGAFLSLRFICVTRGGQGLPASPPTEGEAAGGGRGWNTIPLLFYPNQTKKEAVTARRVSNSPLDTFPPKSGVGRMCLRLGMLVLQVDVATLRWPVDGTELLLCPRLFFFWWQRVSQLYKLMFLKNIHESSDWESSPYHIPAILWTRRSPQRSSPPPPPTFSASGPSTTPLSAAFVTGAFCVWNEQWVFANC